MRVFFPVIRMSWHFAATIALIAVTLSVVAANASSANVGVTACPSVTGPCELLSVANGIYAESDTGEISANESVSLNQATASGFASIELGTLDVEAYGRESPRSAKAGTWVRDVLLIEVPAGLYPNGLQASIWVKVDGTFTASGHSTSFRQALLERSFGGTTADDETWSTYSNSTISYDELYQLKTTLVEPGTLLDAPLQVDADVYVALGVRAYQATGSFLRWAKAEFTGKLWAELPREATATSESGVFPITGANCLYDYLDDGDVDGDDLAEFSNAFPSSELEAFALEFGRVDCLP